MTDPKVPEVSTLYRVYFSQPNNADHQAFALVPNRSADQLGAVLYHVVGMLALGMDHETRRSRDIRKEKGYSRHMLLGQLKPEDVQRFEKVCQDIKVPCDERLLFESRAKLEARGENIRDCGGWIDDVIVELDKQHILIRPDGSANDLQTNNGVSKQSDM